MMDFFRFGSHLEHHLGIIAKKKKKKKKTKLIKTVLNDYL